MARLSKAKALRLMLAYHKEDADRVYRAEFREEWDNTKVFALLVDHGIGGIKKYVTPLADLRQYEELYLTLAANAASQKAQEENDTSSELPGEELSGDFVTGLDEALD